MSEHAVKSRLFRELGRGTIISLTARILGALLGLIWSLLLARLIGPSGSGTYYLAFSIIMLAATLCSLGFSNVVVRLIGSDNGKHREKNIHTVYWAALTLELIICTFIISVVFTIGSTQIDNLFNNNGIGSLLSVMILSLPALVLIGVSSSALRGLRNIAGSSITNTVIAPVFFVSGGLILNRSLNMENLGYLFVAGASGAACFGAWCWRRTAPFNQPALPGEVEKVVRELWYGGMPLLGVALLDLIMKSAPILLLGIWHPPAAVGIFGSADRVAGMISFALTAVSAIGAPMIAALYHQRKWVDLAQLVHLASLMAAAMGIPLLLLITLAPGWVMGLFGTEFKAGDTTLIILSLGYTIKAITGIATVMLTMVAEECLLLRIITLGVALNLIFSVMLIPDHGMLGAAIASAASSSLESILIVYFIWRRFEIIALPWFHFSRYR